MRKHLKLQQELFLAFTIDRLVPPPSSHAPKGQNAGVSAKKGGYSGTTSPGTPRPGTPVAATPKADTEKEDTESEKSTASTRVLVAPARGETRNLILETLTQISRHPSFMVDLYANYDCDINCENIFERLIHFLTKVISNLGILTFLVDRWFFCVGHILVGPYTRRCSSKECTISLSRPITSLCKWHGNTCTGCL